MSFRVVSFVSLSVCVGARVVAHVEGNKLFQHRSGTVLSYDPRDAPEWWHVQLDDSVSAHCFADHELTVIG